MSLSLSTFLVLPQISLVKYYETIKILMQIFFMFQIAFSQWRAGLLKKLFWDVFLRLASFIFKKNFSFNSPALHIFFIKKWRFLLYLWGKYFSCKIFTVLHQSKKCYLIWTKNEHKLSNYVKKNSTPNCNGGLHSA